MSMQTKKRHTPPSPFSQRLLGLIFGILFGFLLHKSGATRYDVILGQLLLVDFTVVKIMLSAVVVGMIGIYFMKSRGWVDLYPKGGSLGQSLAGGLVFGVGFAVLGYCPGTIAGAMGNGFLDALAGGLPGILAGAGLYALVYPRMKTAILKKGDFGTVTLPQLLRVNPWVVIIPLAALITLFLYWLEQQGL